MSRLTTFLLTLSIVCHADTTIKKHTVVTDSKSSANVEKTSDFVEILYRKGALRKSEHPNTSITRISNCDTRTGFLIDLKTNEYKTYKVVKYRPTAQIEEYINKNPENAVDIESTTVDTEEQKTFFGHPAKHFITTTKRASDKNDTGRKETVEGWYIDQELPDDHCDPEYVRTEPYYAIGTALVTPPQLPRLHHKRASSNWPARKKNSHSQNPRHQRWSRRNHHDDRNHRGNLRFSPQSVFVRVAGRIS